MATLVDVHLGPRHARAVRGGSVPDQVAVPVDLADLAADRGLAMAVLAVVVQGNAVDRMALAMARILRCLAARRVTPRR